MAARSPYELPQDRIDLAALRLVALDELAHALVRGAPAPHLRRVSTLVLQIEARLGAELPEPAPTLARRMTLAGEADAFRGA